MAQVGTAPILGGGPDEPRPNTAPTSPAPATAVNPDPAPATPSGQPGQPYGYFNAADPRSAVPIAPVVPIAPGAAPSSGNPAQLARANKEITAGGVMLGLIAAMGVIALVDVAAGDFIIALVAATVGALLLIAGLITLIVGLVRRSQNQPRPVR